VSDKGVLRPVPHPATETCLADGRAVICCREDGSLTFGGLCPGTISSQPSTINNCLTLRFAHSLAPAVNTHCYAGTTIR